MNRLRMSRSFKFFALAAMASPGACGLADDRASDTEDVTSVSAALTLKGEKWPNGQVPVCWDRTDPESMPSFNTYVPIIREQVRETWGQFAKIDFTGWGECPGGAPGKLSVSLVNGSVTVLGYGYNANGVRLRLGLGNGTATANGIYYYVANAFARAIGFGSVGGTNLDGEPENADPESLASFGRVTFFDVWGAQIAYGARPSPMVPMAIAYNPTFKDTNTVSIGAGRTAVNNQGGYLWSSSAGWALSVQAPGTRPLLKYWNAARQDTVLVSTQAGINDAFAAGYSFVRTEGYAYESPQPGTVPLELRWSGNNQDNLTMTSPAEVGYPGSYSSIRNEGYVFRTYDFASWIGPISEEWPAGDQRPPGIRCPGHGYGVRGAGCQGGYCDDMFLWCAPVLATTGTRVDTSPDDPTTWSAWISEETTAYQHNGHTVVGNTIGCENSFGAPLPNHKIIDGIKASGGSSDDVSIHCASLAAGHTLVNGSCTWTPAFSEEQGWQYFPTVDPNNPVANKVAVAVRCTGSNCDNMSYLTCAVN